ncbi:MAG: hypothetical protein ACE5KX_07155 [Acidimicrobiia bacterium]
MRLTSMLLADAAQVTGGKLHMIGGAFDTVNAHTFPAVHASIAVVLVAEVGPQDRNRDLDVTVRLIDEDGNDIGVESRGKLRVGAPSALPAGAMSLVPMVSQFLNVRFPEPKGYAFVAEHDGEELGRVPFRVRRISP